MDQSIIKEFVRESNAIEKIFREPLQVEVNELTRFMELKTIGINDLQQFVSIYQPDARLRDTYGLDVRVGSYYPPFGAPEIRIILQKILDHQEEKSAYSLHIDYELLHPFTDGNGRSGRALWAWKMKNLEGGFLLNFYYQCLQNEGKK